MVGCWCVGCCVGAGVSTSFLWLVLFVVIWLLRLLRWLVVIVMVGSGSRVCVGICLCCLGGYVFVCALLVCVAFGGWLVSSGDVYVVCGLIWCVLVGVDLVLVFVVLVWVLASWLLFCC